MSSYTRGMQREFVKTMNRRANFTKIQTEAKYRPGSVRVDTAHGTYWLSPIEFKLYDRMCGQGLHPSLQYCIKGYFVDFAFPDVNIAVEADGAAYHCGEHRPRDFQRERIIRSAGWTVMRFDGSTIHQRPADCAITVKREVEGRRAWMAGRARQMEMERQRRREAFIRPFKSIAQLFSRNRQ